MNNETEIFRQKAESYLICYNDQCERSSQCLRRKLADYVPATRRIVESVNADYVASQQGECVYFRSAEPMVQKKGLKHFYDLIPERIAHEIRRTLIMELGNSNYYRYRNGELLINTAVRQRIESVCRQKGWMGELAFDEEVMDYDW